MKQQLYEYLIKTIPTTADILDEEVENKTEYGLFVQGLIKEMEKAYDLGRLHTLQEKQRSGQIIEGENAPGLSS